MRKRPRPVLSIVVCLLLGVIINLAVAWGLYLWRPFEGHQFRPATTSEAERVWDRCWPQGSHFADDPKNRHYNPIARFTATPAYRIIIIQDKLGQPGQSQWPEGSAWEFQAGWPARSMVGQLRQFDRSTHGLAVIKDTWVPIKKHGSPIEDDYLPVRPFWPGFAINTAFYTAILWLVFVGPFALRRHVRSKHGHCPQCGYDLHGRVSESTVCPECGAALRLTR